MGRNTEITNGFNTSSTQETSLQVLSLQDIESIKVLMSDMQSIMLWHVNWIKDFITMGEQNPAIQSFYSAGNCGKEVQEKLKKIAQNYTDYYNLLFTGELSLYTQTLAFCDKQTSLLNSSIVDGTPNIIKNGGRGVVEERM